MHLGRFHAAVNDALSELRAASTIEGLQRLVSQLSQTVSNSDPSLAKQFREGWSSFRKSLEAAASNSAQPTKRRIWDELGASKYLGVGLLRSIERILSDNNYTPSLGLAELQSLLNDAQKFQQSLIAIDSEFTNLNVEYEDLDDGEGEVGVKIPRLSIPQTLTGLADELKELDFIFKTINEVASSSLPVELRLISSSDWLLYLSGDPTFYAAVSIAIERIVALYKSLLEIKKLKKELESHTSNQDLIALVQKEIDEKMQTGLRRTAENMVAELYKSQDEARRNELNTALSIALKKLAVRIDKGYLVEVRLLPPPQVEPPEGATEEDRALLEQNRHKSIEFANEVTTRGREVLRLQETEETLGLLEAPEKIDDTPKGEGGTH